MDENETTKEEEFVAEPTEEAEPEKVATEQEAPKKAEPKAGSNVENL